MIYTATLEALARAHMSQVCLAEDVIGKIGGDRIRRAVSQIAAALEETRFAEAFPGPDTDADAEKLRKYADRVTAAYQEAACCEEERRVAAVTREGLRYAQEASQAALAEAAKFFQPQKSNITEEGHFFRARL